MSVETRWGHRCAPIRLSRCVGSEAGVRGADPKSKLSSAVNRLGTRYPVVAINLSNLTPRTKGARNATAAVCFSARFSSR